MAKVHAEGLSWEGRGVGEEKPKHAIPSDWSLKQEHVVLMRNSDNTFAVKSQFLEGFNDRSERIKSKLSR